MKYPFSARVFSTSYTIYFFLFRCLWSLFYSTVFLNSAAMNNFAALFLVTILFFIGLMQSTDWLLNWKLLTFYDMNLIGGIPIMILLGLDLLVAFLFFTSTNDSTMQVTPYSWLCLSSMAIVHSLFGIQSSNQCTTKENVEKPHRYVWIQFFSSPQCWDWPGYFQKSHLIVRASSLATES